MSVLELRQVTKCHGHGTTEVHALRGVDLVVEAGELVAVMGPSGSGKCTLLTIAGSLETVTDGQVFVNGVDLASSRVTSGRACGGAASAMCVPGLQPAAGSFWLFAPIRGSLWGAAG